MNLVAGQLTVAPRVMNLGPTELLLVLAVLVLLFGAKKLPELARGSGRALRIFKAETSVLLDEADRPPGAEKLVDLVSEDPGVEAEILASG